MHLYGGYNVIRAAWPHFREQSFGRVVVATSTSGLFGNFGQANYGAAKLGLVGLINTLAQEGAKYNIKTNALAPIAATRMTEDILPPEVLKNLTPEFVAPVMAYLCTEEVPDTGSIFIVGGGRCNAPRCSRTRASPSPHPFGRRHRGPLVGDRRPLERQAGHVQSSVIDESLCSTGTFRDRRACPTWTCRRRSRTRQVLVDVRAAGVCFPDLLLSKGEYQLKVPARSSRAWRSPASWPRTGANRDSLWGVFRDRRCWADMPNRLRCRPPGCAAARRTR